MFLPRTTPARRGDTARGAAHDDALTAPPWPSVLDDLLVDVWARWAREQAVEAARRALRA